MRKSHHRFKLDQALYFPCILAFLLIARLIAMALIPLNDSTEARYGEIARKMLETNDWVTLWHDYGVPFWGKPPLSTWLSALSMKALGVTAFAARLPALVLSIGILYLVYYFIARQFTKNQARTTVVLLASSLLFFIDAGAVMTDPAFLFTTTLTLIAFWNRLNGSKPLWGYLFFVGLGLGLLAKGPLIFILTAPPVFFWTLFNRQWTMIWKQLPWFSGTALMLLIALPWYALAERHTPGFLNYFIIGEHFSRFLVPGWTGDKYGFAHSQPLGMIWIYCLIATIPWSIVALLWSIKHRKQLKLVLRPQSSLTFYLILWALTPLLFFSFARNIIYTYALSGLPALLMLMTLLWYRQETCSSESKLKHASQLASITASITLIVTACSLFLPQYIDKTQKPVIAAWEQEALNPADKLYYWSSHKQYSAEFYARGKIFYTQDNTQIDHQLNRSQPFYLVINSEELPHINTAILARLKAIYSMPYKDEQFILFKKNGLTAN